MPRSRHPFPALASLIAACLAALALPAPASAGTNLVLNGGFETCIASGVNVACTNQQVNNNTPTSNLLGWTTSSQYSFVTPTLTTTGSGATANTTVNVNTTNYGTLSMWTFPTLSPDGGGFLLQDSSFLTGTISQTLTGLVVGQAYLLSFYQAAAQQNGYTGSTTDAWQVTFGASTQTSTTMNDPYASWVPWMLQTMTFVATAASQTLGFLATSPTGGQPPFAALDGVSVVAVPEPSSGVLAAVGLAGLFLFRRRRATLAHVYVSGNLTRPAALPQQH